MKFDNERTVDKLQALKKLYAIGVISSIVILYTTNLSVFLSKHFGINRVPLIIFFIVVYLIYYFYHIFSRTSYFYFSDEGVKIVVRFYTIKSINARKNSIEIPKNQFFGYKVLRSFLKEEVELYQKNGKQISKYPPFSIKGLKKVEKQKLFTTLDQYVKLY